MVHFDFQAGTPSNTGHSLKTYTSGGVTVTVTGWTTDPTPGAPRSGGYGRVTPLMGSVGGEDAGLYEGTSGLGVFQAGTDSKNLDGGDGASEPDEAMMFIFDRQVELAGMNFNRWNDDGNIDRISFFADSIFVQQYGGTGVSDHAALSMVGTMFVLTATDDATSVRIQDLDVRVIDLPEPAAIALAMAALAALALNRRVLPAARRRPVR